MKKNNAKLEALEVVKRETERYVSDIGGKLESFNIIDLDHQDSLWYGGEVAAIRYKDTVFVIAALGDVRAMLVDKNDGDRELVYVKDKSNGARFYDEMSQYIKNDKALAKSLNTCALELENNNWWECYAQIDGSESLIDMMMCLDSDAITDCVTEVADLLDELYDFAKSLAA